MRALFLIFAFAFTALPTTAFAHCQIPCGIYDDERAFAVMEEHARTILRSVTGIRESKSTHDTVRWTMNKEEHAQKIQDTAQSYFLAQRVKVKAKDAEGYDDYVTSTTLLHQIIVAAMKAKQTAQVGRVTDLQNALEAYKNHYWKLHGHSHSE